VRVIQVAASVAASDGGPTTGVLGLNAAYNRRPGTSALAIATDANGRFGRLDETERNLLTGLPGVALRVLSRSRPFRLKNSWRLCREVLREVSGADLVHIHGVYLAHSVWAWIAARRHGRPYIVQPHGALEPYQAQFGRLRKRLWDLVIGRRVLTGAAALLAASDDEARHLRDLLPGTHVIVTPLGTTTGPTTIDADMQRRLAPWLAAPQHKRVLFLGRLARKKCPDRLLEAWNRLDSGVLAVVGPDGEWTAEELRSLILPDRTDSTIMAGGTDAPGVRWFMAHAGVFVLPSESENFGISVAEAMAGGAAVVTTRQTAAAEHVTAAGAGVVLERPDPQLLADALERLLRHPEDTVVMGRRGHAYARDHLTWDGAAERLLLSLPNLDAAIAPGLTTAGGSATCASA
jgi:glycosyltransferase involved in cell wall biosynthesis